MGDEAVMGLIRRYMEAYNAFDVDGMVKLLHDGIEFRNYANGSVTTETRGIESFRRLAEQSKALFGERRQTITYAAENGGRIEVGIDYEGTLAADLPNGMKAGERIRLQGKSVFVVKEGKLTVIEDYS